MFDKRPGLRALRFAALLIALAGVVIVPIAVDRASAATAESGWQMITVDANAAAYDTPQLDGDYVVYRGPSQNEVFLYQISTGTKTKINTTAMIVNDVCIDGRYVAWSSSGIWAYDIATGSPAQKIGLMNGTDVRVSGSRIVWRAPSTQTTGMWDLYVHDMSMGSAYALGLDVAVVSDPTLDDDHLAWTQGAAGASDIILHDLGTGTFANLSATRGTGLADTTPDVADGIVVWVGNDGSDTEIFMYDCSSGVERQLTNDSWNCQDPLTDGRWVAWNQGLDAWLADAKAADPAASTQLVAGTGQGNSWVYYKALGGGWLVCSGANTLLLHDASTGMSNYVSRDALNGWRDQQTDGQRIVVVEDNNKIRLFEKSSTTTTMSTTTTTTLPTTTTTTSSTTTTSVPATTTTTLPGGQTFWDVPPSHPYYEAIEGMADDGVIDGYDDGSFGPSKLVMRQQFAKMIVGTLGFSCSEADICPFWDVTVGGPATLYPDNYIAVAAAWGITNGIGGGRFGPYLNITRAQMITMVVRAAQNFTAGLQAPDAAYYQRGLFAGFNDPTHGYNAQLAEFNGLMDGIQGSGSIGTWVWQPATRGEVAQILWNLINTPGLAG